MFLTTYLTNLLSYYDQFISHIIICKEIFKQ